MAFWRFEFLSSCRWRVSEISNRGTHFHRERLNICHCGDYIQLPAPNIRAFGCEDYLSLNTWSGGSLMHCAILHISIRAQYLRSGDYIKSYPRRRHLWLFGCEEYLTPRNLSGELLIQCTIIQTCIRAQHLPCGNYLLADPRSIHPKCLAVKIISHPILRLGGHSFIAPCSTYFCPRLIPCLEATIYERIRAQDISGVSAVKNISHPLIHLGSHSFSLSLYIKRGAIGNRTKCC